jgi:hypothetical protein
LAAVDFQPDEENPIMDYIDEGVARIVRDMQRWLANRNK